MEDFDFAPSGETIETWTTGFWTSQLCRNELGRFSGGSSWGWLSWDEDETTDETQAYVRVDILDSSDTPLVNNLTRKDEGIDLNTYAAIGASDNIKIRVKLYSYTKIPQVKNLTLAFHEDGLDN
jgi:hypothetical protein